MQKTILTVAVLVLLSLQSCSDMGTNPVPEYYNRDNDVLKLMRERVDYFGRDVGITVGIINGNETKIFSYGKLNKYLPALVDSNTIFEIGSITKTFTCTMLADMVLKGELSLDDPVQKFLPARVKMPAFNGKEITLRNLATHTSGLPRDPTNYNGVNYTMDQFYNFLSGCRLTRAPGSVYDYSNAGMALLGYVLVLKTGMDYDVLLREKILKPLAMNDTYIDVPDSAMARYATPYGATTEETSTWFVTEKNLVGCGAIRSTMCDMMKYVKANMGIIQTPLLPAMRLAQTVMCPMGEYRDSWVGLGWHMLDLAGTRFITHSGATFGCATSIYFDPVGRLAAITLTNSRAFSSTIDDVANFTLYDIMMGEKTGKADVSRMNDFIGTYRLSPNAFTGSNFTITISREGDCLFATLTNEPKWEIYPDAGNKYFFAVLNSTLTFISDGSGSVTGVTWWYEGTNYGGTKIN